MTRRPCSAPPAAPRSARDALWSAEACFRFVLALGKVLLGLRYGTDRGWSNLMSISVYFGRITSRPWRLMRYRPENAAAASRALPAVEASVAVDKRASATSWKESSVTLAIPAVTPRSINTRALPGFPPLSPPSESIRICDPFSTSASASEAAMSLRAPPGRVNPVNVKFKEPGRLNQRGGTLLVTRPSTMVPSGSVVPELRRTGSKS